MRKKILWLFHFIFNLRLSILALLFIGGMVSLINLQHGWWEALRAGAIAGGTITLTSGLMIRFIQHAALVSRWWISYPLGTLVPSIVTGIMHAPGQTLNQTPELFWSVASPVLLTFVTSLALNYLTKRYIDPNRHSWGWIDKILEPIGRIPGTQPRS